MSTFTLAISCLTISNLPWFMNLTFQVPMQYCSLQHRTLLPSQIISTAGCCFCFGSISSFFLESFLHWSPVAYWAPTDLESSSFSVLSFCPIFSYCSWGSQDRNTEVVCHSLLQWRKMWSTDKTWSTGDCGRWLWQTIWSSCCPVYQVFCWLISLYFLESQEPAQNPTGEIVSP